MSCANIKTNEVNKLFSHHFMQYFQEWCPLMPVCSCENSFPEKWKTPESFLSEMNAEFSNRIQTKANGCIRSHASIGYRPGNVKMPTKRGLYCHKMIPR